MKDNGPLANEKIIDGEAIQTDVAPTTKYNGRYSNWDFINGLIAPVEILNGTITSNRTLKADTKISLTGSFIG